MTRHARALGIAALIAMFAACGSPPAPAPLPESQPWCVALDRYLQTHAGKQSDLVCAGNEPRARALSDCEPIAIERRSLPRARVYEGGPALDPAPGSWLARALVQGGPGLQRVTIDLEGAELERVASPAETLSAAAHKGQCGELRRALCLAEPDVLEARLIAKPVVRMLDRDDRVVRIAASEPVVIATRIATAGFVLGDRSACRGVGGRAPTREERAAFHDVKTHYASAWLGSVQCHMLERSVPMLNSLCNGKPCSAIALFREVYGEPLRDLDEHQQRAICGALDSDPALASCGVDLSGKRGTFSCRALAPWLQRHGDKPWCEVSFSTMCGRGILAPKHAPVQIEIVRDMLAHVPERQRSCVADRLLDAWRSYSPAPFERAESAWKSLVERCQPIGCNFGRVTTDTPWREVERALLSGLLAHFSMPGSIDVNPGCHSVWLNYDDEWRVAPGASSGFGLSPADPADIRRAAERFAKSE